MNRNPRCRFKHKIKTDTVQCWGYVGGDGFCGKCGQPQDWRLEDEPYEMNPPRL